MHAASVACLAYTLIIMLSGQQFTILLCYIVNTNLELYWIISFKGKTSIQNWHVICFQISINLNDSHKTMLIFW